MRTAGTKRAIRNALYRLGLHTTPKAVADVLRGQGVLVDEGLVRQVRFEMLKEAARGKVGKVARPAPPPGVRCRPQGFPGRRDRGMNQGNRGSSR
jgi:hypothetical protein